MELSEDFDGVAELKKARVKGGAARQQRLESFEIVDEKDLVERTTALLARMGL